MPASYNPEDLVQLKHLVNLGERVNARINAITSTSGQANVIEKIKVNGSEIAPDAAKAVNITVGAGDSDGQVKIGGSNVTVKGFSDLASKVAALIGTGADADTGKTARDIAAEEVAKIVGGAPEAYDTLQEIAAWIQDHPDDASAMNEKLTLGTHDVTTYVHPDDPGKYVEGTTYYTDDTGTTPVDTSSFTAGETDVSSYYIAQTSAQQYETVKAYADAILASFVGTGVITSIAYTPATGAIAVTRAGIASDDNVTAALNSVFGES